MPLFSKPIANVYVNELRTRLDKKVVPIFMPDTTLEVGDFGSFEDGQFVGKGNVRDKGVDYTLKEKPVGGFDFASSGKVTIGPSVTVPSPTGGDLVKATITFSKARAVVVSFKGGKESAVSNADDFGEALMRLWLANELRRDRAVVWSVRSAAGGTVMASEEGDNTVDVLADAAVLGAAGLTIPNMNVGVQFGNERKSTWKMSEPDLAMTVWVRLLRVGKHHADDAFGFEPGSDELAAAAAATKPDEVVVDDLLAQLEPTPVS
jgi:hypothetical protein